MSLTDYDLRLSIVAEAIACRDTPFKHQGRLKGVGMDCIGLPIHIAHTLGTSQFDIRGYPVQPNETEFHQMLEQVLGPPIPRESVALGDLLTFFVDRFQHVGIVSCMSPLRVIHVTSLSPRKCCEFTLDREHNDRLGRAYHMPGVT